MLSKIIIFSLCFYSFSQSIPENRSSSYIKKYYSRYASNKIKTCQIVAHRAQRDNLDAIELITLSFIETRHTNHLTSKKGAKGALQALPRYWSRPTDKDFIDAGLRAWKYYKLNSSSLQETAGRYNGAGEGSYYARSYLKHYQKLKRLQKTLEAGARL